MDFTKYRVEPLKIVYRNPNPKGILLENTSKVHVNDIETAQSCLGLIQRQMVEVKEYLVRKDAYLEEDKTYDPIREEYSKNCKKATEDFYRDAFAELGIPEDHPKKEKMISHAWDATDGRNRDEEYPNFFYSLKQIWELIK